MDMFLMQLIGGNYSLPGNMLSPAWKQNVPLLGIVRAWPKKNSFSFGSKGDTIHLICEVHDDGPFHLVDYRRIIINIRSL